MRSPNKRSRSKSNRPKTLGNIVNRVFDSSGPEGKVRGTPQQIIEKYQVLARDAQLSNDRVAAENFQQHAEHYTRMLAQAQREIQAEQEARRQQHEERQRQANEERNNNHDRGHSNGQQNHNRRDAQRASGPAEAQGNEAMRDSGSQGAFAVQEDDLRPDQDSLVETPESQTAAPAAQPDTPAQSAQPAKPARKPRAPRTAKAPASKAKAEATTQQDAGPKTEAETGSAAAKPARRYTRKPRQSNDGVADEASQSAAE